MAMAFPLFFNFLINPWLTFTTPFTYPSPKHGSGKVTNELPVETGDRGLEAEVKE